MNNKEMREQTSEAREEEMRAFLTTDGWLTTPEDFVEFTGTALFYRNGNYVTQDGNVVLTRVS